MWVVSSVLEKGEASDEIEADQAAERFGLWGFHNIKTGA